MSKSEKKGNKTVKRDSQGRFQPGTAPGPGHSGGKNFNTLFDEAIKKIAESENIEEDNIERDLVANAIKQARKSKYRFYKDTMDRRYGEAKKKMDIGGDMADSIKELAVSIKELAKDEK